MADPLSITGSVAGLITLSMKLATTVHDASGSIETCQQLYDLVNETSSVLENLRKRLHPDTPLQAPLLSLNKVLGRAKKKIPASGGKTKKIVKWLWRRNGIEEDLREIVMRILVLVAAFAGDTRSSIGSLEVNVLSAISKLGMNGHRIEETASRTEKKFDQLYTLVLRLGQQNGIPGGVRTSIPRLSRIARKGTWSARTMQLRIQHRKPRAQKRVRQKLEETTECSQEPARLVHREQAQIIGDLTRTTADAKAMKSIATITILFLPASFIASVWGLM